MKRLLADVHALNESVLEGVDVLDHSIEQHVSGEIAHDLMDTDHDSSLTVFLEGDGIHMWINHAPLAAPVGTDAVVAVHGAALHAVGPFDIRAHGCQGLVNIAGIERRVCALQ